jgi:hypothetical protein
MLDMAQELPVDSRVSQSLSDGCIGCRPLAGILLD